MSGIINTFFDSNLGAFRAERRGTAPIGPVRSNANPNRNSDPRLDSKTAKAPDNKGAASKGADSITDATTVTTTVTGVDNLSPLAVEASQPASAVFGPELTQNIKRPHVVQPGLDLAKMHSVSPVRKAQQVYAQHIAMNRVSLKGGMVDSYS